jgi:hypothetical protein
VLGRVKGYSVELAVMEEQGASPTGTGWKKTQQLVRLLRQKGVLTWLLLAVLWNGVALFYPPSFFPGIGQTVVGSWEIIQDGTLVWFMLISLLRVYSGWLLGSLLAVPVGLLIGRSEVVRELAEPFVNFFRAIPAIAYGGLYDDGVQSIVIAPGGTEPVVIGEAMSGDNVTLGTNTITINQGGNYQVEFMVMLQSTTGTFDLSVGVQINGNFSEPSLLIGTEITSDFEFIKVGSIVTLSAGDILGLAVSSTTGGSLLFGPSLNVSLSVMRLGG